MDDAIKDDVDEDDATATRECFHYDATGGLLAPRSEMNQLDTADTKIMVFIPV